MTIWKTAKRLVRLSICLANDLCGGARFRFARPGSTLPQWPVALNIEQDVLPSETLDQKCNNIRLGGACVSRAVVLPNQIFSFWHLVGNPSSRKGYQASRNIVRGQLSLETGGGLCQLAGLVYHLGLQAGLAIVERHAHSVDIYTEDERFTPLGSDAAVVYGYKDLRLLNTTGKPIRFDFELRPGKLIGRVHCPEKLPVYRLEFQRKQEGREEVVQVLRYHANRVENLGESRYVSRKFVG